MATASRVVMVTGGNRGIGFATSRALAERGAHVVITARDTARGQASAGEIRAIAGDRGVVHPPYSRPGRQGGAL